MEQHDQGPIEILKKHLELNPKFTVVASFSHNNEITLDMSHPMDLKEVAVISLFIQRHIGKVLDQTMSAPKPAPVEVPTPPEETL